METDSHQEQPPRSHNLSHLQRVATKNFFDFHSLAIIAPNNVGAMKKDEALYILETFLTEEQLFRLKRIADMTGAPISTLIRIAAADYLKNLPVRLSQGRNRPTTTGVVAQTHC